MIVFTVAHRSNFQESEEEEEKRKPVALAHFEHKQLRPGRASVSYLVTLYLSSASSQSLEYEECFQVALSAKRSECEVSGWGVRRWS